MGVIKEARRAEPRSAARFGRGWPFHKDEEVMKINIDSPPSEYEILAELAKLRKKARILHVMGWVGIVLLLACIVLSVINLWGLFSSWVLLAIPLLFLKIRSDIKRLAPIQAKDCELVKQWKEQSAAIANYIAKVNMQGRELFGWEFIALKRRLKQEQDFAQKAAI